MTKKLENILEEVLQKVIAAVEVFFGPLTTVIDTPLVQKLLIDREEIEIPCGPGKQYLAARSREEGLLVRLALSPEAHATGCLPEAKEFAEYACKSVFEAYPEIRGEFRIIISKITPGGVPEPLGSFPQQNQVTRAGI